MKIVISFLFFFFAALTVNKLNAQAPNVQYSAVVKVIVNKGVEAVAVFPNPVEGNTINMKLTAEKGNYTIILTNQLGQIVYTQALNHNGGTVNQQVIVNNNFISGNYQLQVLGNNFSQTIKVLKP